MNSRFERLKNVIKENDIDIMFITDGYNVDYISGYKGHCGIMLVLPDDKIILTDSRYTEQVTIEAPDFCCVDITKDGYSKQITRILNESCSLEKVYRIGFEDEEISYRQYAKIKESIDVALQNRFELIPMGGKINALRMVKDADEISKISRAEQIGDEAFKHIVGYIKAGMTEKQVALELEYKMKLLGASGLSFDTIAASGENSSLPHAVPTDRVLRDGDFLTMDFGCVYQGYCSDMTRTIFIGNDISEEQKKVYDTVLKAQLESLKLLKPGIKCSDVDACAREIIAEAGYGEYFGHGLGHSVGLYIHEEPRCSKKCDTILEPGMTMTCEPGIYLPGKFGVRIEDLVVITEDGCKNLASSPKELICL